MAVILPSERRTFKAWAFLAAVYAILALGGITMVLPLMIMLAGSFSSAYDYNRHSPVINALFDREDRFMRSVAAFFPRDPQVLPGSPAGWSNWTSVADDPKEVKRVAGAILAKTRGLERAATLEAARRYRQRTLDADIRKCVCDYDARDVPGFVKTRYGGDIAKMNSEWTVRYRSFFDVSFFAESRIAFWHDGWKEPSGGKWAAWLDFKDYYRRRMVERGDWVCRTRPYGEAGREDAWAALAMEFDEHGWRDFAENCFANYALVSSYLFVRGRAFVNTIILVVLSIAAALSVNPLAAYALSRFRMRGTEKILVFLLATSAFPAAVTAIPGFLLIRDLGLLNTFAALVLPTVASGMGIFILKGFFDALPRELYEAAAIDGAGEWLIFRKITLPMTAPILAVNALSAFLAAYNSWAWAFLVCQKPSHWTLAVWMYQMSENFAGQPWCVMAGFTLVSIPVAVVFIACQKVILRGVVLPSMK